MSREGDPKGNEKPIRLSPYNVLGVSSTATDEDIKAAHRKLVKKYHIDAGGDQSAMRQLNAAWDILKDPDKRAAYDAANKLKTATGAAGGGFSNFSGGFTTPPEDRMSPKMERELGLAVFAANLGPTHFAEYLRQLEKKYDLETGDIPSLLDHPQVIERVQSGAFTHAAVGAQRYGDLMKEWEKLGFNRFIIDAGPVIQGIITKGVNRLAAEKGPKEVGAYLNEWQKHNPHFNKEALLIRSDVHKIVGKQFRILMQNGKADEAHEYIRQWKLAGLVVDIQA